MSALFNSSLIFAASDSVVCETVGDLTSGFPGKAFLTDSRQVCFKTVDDNRAVFTPSSASSLFYFPSTVLSAVGSAGVVFSGRSGDVWSHKNQWLTESPSQASVLETLLKNRLIPDASFSREVNDRKRNRLEGELERAIVNWQQLVKKPSYPAVAISVSDASMRVVITRSDILRGTSLASLYEELINIQTQSYLALLDTEALNDIAGIVTGGLVASGSGGDGDDNDSTHYSFDAEPDAEPLVMVYDDSEYPAQDSAEELIAKNQENKRRLLKVLRKKMQQSIALGRADLARILDNRVMLIEADLEHLNDLETSSAGITENDQGSLGILSFLMASLVTDNQELQQRDDNALVQTLSQYPLSTDYRSVLIVSSELTHEEALFYDRWQNTATGLVYRALKRRLMQQLRSETDDINVSTQQTEPMVSGLKALVHQFREMFSADLSSPYDGRQVPHQGKHIGKQESNAARAAGDGQEIRVSRNTHTNIAFQSYEGLNQEGDEGDEPPRKKVHTGSNNCPLCNHGVCSQKVSGADGSALTAAEENEKLPNKCFNKCIKEDYAITIADAKRYPELIRAIEADPQFYIDIINASPGVVNTANSLDSEPKLPLRSLKSENILSDYLKIMITAPKFQLKKLAEAKHSIGAYGGHGKTIIKIQHLGNSRIFSQNVVDIKVLLSNADECLQEEIIKQRHTSFNAYNKSSVIISPDEQHLLTLDVHCKLRVYNQQDGGSWVVRGTSDRFRHGWDDAADYDYYEDDPGSMDSEDDEYNSLHPCPVARFLGNRHLLMHNTHNLEIWTNIPEIKEPLIKSHISSCVISSDQQLAVSIDRKKLKLTFWTTTENGKLEQFVYSHSKEIQDGSLLIAPNAHYVAFRDSSNAITLLGSDGNNGWLQQTYFISDKPGGHDKLPFKTQFSDNSRHLLIHNRKALYVLSLKADDVWFENELWHSQEITAESESLPKCSKIASICISSNSDRIAIGTYLCPPGTNDNNYLRYSRSQPPTPIGESSIVVWERESDSQWKKTGNIQTDHAVTYLFFSASGRHLVSTSRAILNLTRIMGSYCTPQQRIVFTWIKDAWQETGRFISKDGGLNTQFSPDEVYILLTGNHHENDDDRIKFDHSSLLIAGLGTDDHWRKKLLLNEKVVSRIINKGKYIVTGDSEGKIKLYILLPQWDAAKPADFTDETQQ
ncbi:WD40 repeat domain-containing protein [Endozoicomonas euniceicola]|uniref:WD40 repeat domain-containing protein n=1 Tax=Endozoicomonas euniceicola TaxID=1234143 RepID=A0ABY6GWV0_9GAMM|nr:WD40 repeat domain-containing protein [Endozoicomonas euniceicola]UYM17245.1 WD40 repeat domain-containing protein [Endozoicomonas euniceicola]